MTVDKTESEYEIAVSHYQNERMTEALNVCLKIIQKGLQDPNPLFLAGLILRAQGDIDQSLDMFNQAILLSGDNPLYYVNLGIAYHMGNRLEEAKRCYETAVQLSPGHPEACSNLGQIYVDSGHLGISLDWFNKCLAANPDFYQAWYNMGIAFQKLENLDKAEQCYRECLQINPAFVQALNNLAIVYKNNRKLEKSAETFKALLRMEPGYIDAYNNLGAVFQEMGEIENAIDCYRKSIARDPENMVILMNFVSQLKYACLWEETISHIKRIKQTSMNKLKLGQNIGVTPFDAIQLYDDPEFNLMVSESYALKELHNHTDHEQFYPSDNALIAARLLSMGQTKKKIKVGYVSEDFRDHAVGHILNNLFKVHNREAFEIICYSQAKTMNKENYFTLKIIQNSDQFVDISSLDTIESARTIYQDSIDILVDLGGYTNSGRIGLFALRPAPIQISYLGFLSTSGAPFMDYLIADKIVLPEMYAKCYSEKIIYLPCYQVTTYSHLPYESEWNKKKCGLPENSFIFCSFNQPYKFDSDLFTIWMKLLKKKKNSVLWLRHTSDLAKKNLHQKAQSMGVEPSRLIFSKPIGLGDHLKRLSLADLALDTRGYNGGATTSNALWAGVPVVTLQGNQFVARMSSSSLTAIGMNELVTNNMEQYEKLCMKLISDQVYYQKVRSQLRKNKESSILFDVKCFAKGLDRAYENVWKRYLAGMKTSHIEIS